MMDSFKISAFFAMQRFSEICISFDYKKVKNLKPKLDYLTSPSKYHPIQFKEVKRMDIFSC